MNLSPELIKLIDGLMEKGFTVELRVEEGDPIDQPDGGTIPRPRQVTVFKRPDEAADILIPPTLVNTDSPTTLILTVGENNPVHIARVKLPSGFYVTGIKGYSGSPKIT
ncbi:MAG: hypothetical protein Q8O55_01355 [Dehalococcoidales bacterium]|nr:hypothetical protein [Dehalococcoidales bacterium]